MEDFVTDPERIHRLLDREILTQVRTPARYLGGELNAVRKQPGGVEVSFALLFPDVYEVGMSHLGYQILYSVLNGLKWAAAERAYAVWPDMQQQMREYRIPLYALESFRPVREFDVIGFSLQYELLYTNVLAMLELAGVPLESAQRGADGPIVVGGGPGAAVPEPMAQFIDLFLIGDAEESIVEFAELMRTARAEGWRRRRILREAAVTITGAYVPAFFHPEYEEDGKLREIRPVEEGLPRRVRAAKVASLAEAPFPTAPIVPFVEAVHDRISLEIMRGCARGCRFCQAGMLRRPVRSRPVEQLLEQARLSYRNTGYQEIALTALSASDYPEFERLLEELNEFAEPHNINISLSSLRVDDQLKLVPEAISSVRKSGLTVAPEAATERLRRVINKQVTDQELLEGARAAFRVGWQRIKLYFMIGLPTERPEDVEGIVELSERVSEARREVNGGPARVNVSIAPFVPKAHTPFQWEPMASLEYLQEARRTILDLARMKSVRYRFHDPRRSRLEAALGRGDRRLGAVLARVHAAGEQFDAWDEHFRYECWKEAFEAEGLSMDFYATRRRDDEEVLPWGHIDFGLRKDLLRRERDSARAERRGATGSGP